jgi:hypothetical protein
MANSFGGRYTHTMPFVTYQNRSTQELESLSAPLEERHLLATGPVVEHVPVLSHDSSAFSYHAQQSLSDTVFDVSLGAWSDTTLRPGMHAQESNTSHEGPRVINHDVHGRNHDAHGGSHDAHDALTITWNNE